MKKSKMEFLNSLNALVVATSLSISLAAAPALANDHNHASHGQWMAGDFHNHTFLTDGNNVQDDVLSHAFEYGLNWLANSEHGGSYNRNPQGLPWPAGTEFLGNPSAGKMWRWQSLLQYSYPIIIDARNAYSDKLIIQGYEWNVPTHEHASVGIVGPEEQEGKAIARHEYLFDGSDSGTTSDSYLEVNGKVAANSHVKAVAGAKWLQNNYPQSSYFLLNHPSRQLKYSIASIRDFNNVAPSVAFGFEGIPGHQKEASRGGYGNSFDDQTYKAHTYGGADYMIAKVGGLWDALLGEGRHFNTFANSDFHNTDGDFWPGEYAKSYTFVKDENNDGEYSLNELVDGLRSGNSYAVTGDLINALDFSVKSRDDKAEMGGTLEAKKGRNVTITIRFQSPSMNNNNDSVTVDHIDLIAGEINGKISKYLEDGITPNPEYGNDKNETTKVFATFTKADWKEEQGEDDDYAYRKNHKEGGKHNRNRWYAVEYNVKNMSSNMYFRLRGTNLAPDTENETDSEGNPLIDDLMAPNTPEKAYADLWFYSNPIFVRVR